MGIQVIKGGSSAYLKLAGGVALTSSLVSVVDQTNIVSGLQLATASIGLTMPTFLTVPNWTVTLGIKDGFSSQQTVAVASLGTGVFRLIANKYTINNTGAQTGSVTGYFLNATETALNGITHNLMDLQVGGGSKFRVRSDGSVFATGGDFATNRLLSAQAIFQGQGSGAVLVSETTAFNRLQLGGTTSSFPAIKRNGAQIDFRLADDSAYCSINLLSINAVGNSTLQGSLAVGTGSSLASAILTVESTTRGFLMPRQTTAQILLIATPAAGLQVYNTTLNQPCFYDGIIWNKVNHSPM